jgi:hypothetical protein
MVISCLLTKNVTITIYKSILLPVVLYRSEKWSFTLKEEHGLKVLDSRVQRKIFGSKKREEVNTARRKLHNVELQNLHSSLNTIRVIK